MSVAALALGLVVGGVLGLLGGGGSILAVPALVYGLGMPVSAAVPTSLVVVGVSSATAVVPRVLRSGQVQWRIAAVFGVAGAGTAFGGAAVNRLLDERVVLLGFALIMVGAGVQMLRSDGAPGGDCARPDGGVNWPRCLGKAVGAGAVVGFLTGLFGVGGGFVIVPALTLLLGLPMATAIGTSLVIVVLNAAAGIVAYLGSVDLDYGIVAAFTASAVVASLVAGRFGSRLPADRLRRWFAYLVFAVAVFVAVEAIIDPGTVSG